MTKNLCLSLIPLMVLLASCGNGPSAPDSTPPKNLTYATPVVKVAINSAMTANTITRSGGTPDSFSVSPTLPTGLSFDKTSGTISGTPTVAQAARSYMVTARNSAGYASTSLTILVVGPPGTIDYARPAVKTVIAKAMTPNSVMVSGGAVSPIDSFSITPALPAGFLFDKITGSISGTPAVAQSSAAYTVTAKNIAGSATATVSITVVAPPGNITYAASVVNVIKGSSMPRDTLQPAVGGIDYFTITPALPAGLVIDRATGAISGTPTVMQKPTVHTISAGNIAGTSTTTITIAVVIAPTSVVYARPILKLPVNVSMGRDSAYCQGSSPDSFAVKPALPAGLSIDRKTGAIFGTPSGKASDTAYTVTAKNIAGLATVTIKITVITPPDNYAYVKDTLNLKLGVAMTRDSAISTGSPADSFSVAPPLPAGLLLDKKSGAIYGTPMFAQSAVAYTITAKNSAGASSAAVTIAVIAAPSSLKYATSSLTLSLNTAMTRDTATCLGSPADSFSVIPPLPAGLSLVKTSGVIFGTPSKKQDTTTYSVTAYNIAGSAATALKITVVAPPESLTYAKTLLALTQGIAMARDSVSYTGSRADSFTITPALPAGLSLVKTSGVVYGTPSIAQDTTAYIVTARNSAGSTSDTIKISVSGQLGGLKYETSALNLAINTPMVRDSVTYSGFPADSFSIMPALPPGLSFNIKTGVISGTPTKQQNPVIYTVTARNSKGISATAISIRISTKPDSLTYDKQDLILGKGLAMARDSASYSGSSADSFTIAPALPTGLFIDKVTGAIYGTPIAAQNTAAYTVIAQNVAGIATATLTVRVLNPPSAFTYRATMLKLVKNAAMARDSVIYAGDKADRFTVTPALPSGLAINDTTGVLSGTPTASQNAASYTIIASNIAGADTAKLSIAVIQAPSGLTYATSALRLGQYVAMTRDTLLNTGSEVDSFTVAPSLPAGLFMVKSTGALYGTPLVPQDAKSYLVTAYNAAGVGNVTISIQIIAPPGVLTYQNLTLTVPVNMTISRDSAMLTGVADSFTISPALPAGLLISKLTGAVYGTPTVAATATSYTVTARNVAGTTTAKLSISVIALPANLVYADTVLRLGRDISMPRDSVRYSGGTPDSFTVSPALPAGLTINKTTGVISGTPATAQNAAVYTVIARNIAGIAIARVSIAVIAPLGGIAYTSPMLSLPVNIAMTPDIIILAPGGVIDSFSVTPALPAGLTINKITGTISGTPTVPQAAATYTVTARNVAGTTITTLSIAVLLTAPGGVAYATPNLRLGRLVPMVRDTVICAVSIADSFTVSPQLPAGLAMVKSTGVIYGTPLSAQDQTSYTVTAHNSAGTAATSLTITVLAAPSMVTYMTTVLNLTMNTAITRDTVVYVGGIADSFSVFPALPSGLLLVKTTGVIFGTPLNPQIPTTYTVTARNPGGAATAALSIGVTTICTGNWSGGASDARDSGAIGTIPTATSMSMTMSFKITNDSRYSRVITTSIPVTMYRSQFNPLLSDTTWTTVRVDSDTGSWVNRGSYLVTTPERAWTTNDNGVKVQIASPVPDSTLTTGISGSTWTMPPESYTNVLGNVRTFTPILTKP